MKLDRNENPDGSGKYAIVNMRMYCEAADPNGSIQKAFGGPKHRVYAYQAHPANSADASGVVDKEKTR